MSRFVLFWLDVHYRVVQQSVFPLYHYNRGARPETTPSEKKADSCKVPKKDPSEPSLTGEYHMKREM